jgi:hypothetical protein
MSDAFGQDDTTASGGLQSDMPGIGAAPPKPAQVPNVLGGLASAFKQMFGGSPAPQPARGPMIGPQGQLTPPPPQPGQPRMTGTTASLALPRGAPQPPAKFTPFIKSRPRRDFGEWGQPEQFPSLPQPFEVPSIYQGVGQFFQQNGSQPSIPLAFLLSGHAAEYVKGLQEGQEFKAKMALDNMKLNAAKLQIQQEDEHRVYADVFNEHAALENTMDPTKLDTEALRADLHNQAAQIGDTQMTNLLENGAPLSRIMWFQQQRDATLRDLQKANNAADQQDEQESKQFGVPPDPQTAAQTGGQPGAQAPGSQQQPGATSSNAPPAPQAPGSAPGAAQPGALPPGDQVASNDPSAGVAKPNPDTHLLPYQQVGLDMARGASETTGLPKRVQAAARDYETSVNSQLDAINAHAAGKSEDQVYKDLSAISPTIANDWRGIMHGVPMPGGWSAIGARPYWRNLGGIAQSVNPGWVPEDAQELGTFIKSYDTGPIAQQLVRGGRMGAAGKTALEALNRAVADSPGMSDSALQNKYEAWIAGNLSGDDAWSGVFNSLQTYVQESMAVANGGKPYEGDINRLMKQNYFVSSPGIIRRYLQQDAENTVATLDQLNDDYKNRTNKQTNAPHYNQAQVGLLRGMSQLNTDGTFSGDPNAIPPDLRALAQQPNQPAPLPPGWSW